MDKEIQLYWEAFSEVYSVEEMVWTSANPLREYESDFIDGPIVDIGCGQSHFLIEFSRGTRKLYGLDNDAYQLQKLHEHITAYAGAPRCAVELVPFRLLQDRLPDEQFAVVVLSNILHFFDLVGCRQVVQQISDRTAAGSLVYLKVHSVAYHGNDPADPDNNAYFKHFFTQQDVDALFEPQYERIYAANLTCRITKKDQLVRTKWLEKVIAYLRITDEKAQADFWRANTACDEQSDLVCIYRKK